MNAIICDRCGAVLKGATEPVATVQLTRWENGVAFENNRLILQLCSSCHNDVRAWLERKPARNLPEDGRNIVSTCMRCGASWGRRCGSGPCDCGGTLKDLP